ncbi:MAG: Na+/H+ antiporter subunit B [Deltaproteobacteria bacterium]|jgi:multicomponent Na+:H+ antiporter subunit B|nr:Na+/H+ antiporter subunit B [Deltaproteobacteria bacterium]MDH3772778.1 Na+/H+ antiporter subunit B [Deltaproteobacteria bacterium]MDH3800792.1 Na+/H+ antiporter subunit B [Deltaproteobacteria bacterium]MDH3849537.1 Na+/H+ antiporter subunit B [Deltaproteobacteria bacterium]MDH3897140.1 Na+/H+ antiporter subunit B [Deltaproteobacteria bacterium]
MKSLILQTASRYLIVLLVIFSVFILLRGHNEPGGGFVGGLLIAGAFALYGLAYEPKAARRLLRLDPRTIIGVGLVTAAGSGLAAVWHGQPFLTGQWLPYPIPFLGKLGTVFFFDLGVYLVVLGTALLVLLTLEEE